MDSLVGLGTSMEARTRSPCVDCDFYATELIRVGMEDVRIIHLKDNHRSHRHVLDRPHGRLVIMTTIPQRLESMHGFTSQQYRSGYVPR